MLHLLNFHECVEVKELDARSNEEIRNHVERSANELNLILGGTLRRRNTRDLANDL